MNRYICAGILADLAAGKNVLVVTLTHRIGEQAHENLLRHAMPLGHTDPWEYTYSRANGKQWIEDSKTGARVTFASVLALPIWARADVVVIVDFRHMVETRHADGTITPDDATAARLREFTLGRDVVVID